jgi:hypothetical protein
MTMGIESNAGANTAELSPYAHGRRRNGRELSSELPDHWYANADEIATFAKVLWEGDALRTASDVIDYLDRPQAWTEERDNWILAGEPDSWKSRGA